ncbi:U-actitoxin-Avd9a-like [Pocillopora damicornis]|uniref:U-actitoxin-Avd9a-like n=1 Tax=Pocillopora damicornis TaxID=46731 RepID=UPI000F54D1AA|nr:U-actitoxin-Avd9a-like [Pocillopora damicornis]
MSTGRLGEELTSLYNMKILIVLLAVMLVCSANSVERERDPEVLDSEVLDSDLVRKSRSCGDKFRFRTCIRARRMPSNCSKLYFKIGCRRMCALC